MSTPRVMRQVEAEGNLLECRVCGLQVRVRVEPFSGGKFYRGAWQCPRGCRLDPKRAQQGRASDA